MKKRIVFLLVLAFVLSAVGCSQQVQGNQLLLEGNIISVQVSSLPEGYNDSFHGEDADAIVEYLSNLNLESKFKENPNEYVGMTWEIALKYDNGNVMKMYHFGNLFIRAEQGPWYKMNYDEASRFDALLNALRK